MLQFLFQVVCLYGRGEAVKRLTSPEVLPLSWCNGGSIREGVHSLVLYSSFVTPMLFHAPLPAAVPRKI